ATPCSVTRRASSRTTRRSPRSCPSDRRGSRRPRRTSRARSRGTAGLAAARTRRGGEPRPAFPRTRSWRPAMSVQSASSTPPSPAPDGAAARGPAASDDRPPRTARAVSADRRRRRPGRSQAARGWAYAAPTAAFVLVLFVLPVLLVGQMSASDWPLLAGNRGVNFPDNFRDAVENRFFWDSGVFTLKYTVIATVLLIALGLGFALLVQESSRWQSFLRTSILVPSALGLASASLLFYALYSPQVGPISPLLERLGIVDEPISFLGSPDGALWSTVFLIVWRFAGFYMLLLMVGL